MLRRLILALPVLAIGWIATLAVVMRLGGAAPAAFVPFPPDGFVTALPKDVAITGHSVLSLTVQSEAPDLTKRLYAAGAWLVLPAGLEACIPNFLKRTPAEVQA